MAHTVPVLIDPYKKVRWLAVRCCCAPSEVMGFIETSDDPKLWINVVMKSAVVCGANTDNPVSLQALAVHRFDVRLFLNGLCKQEWAVDSDDHPIEFWRNVQGFVEAAP